jgi:hypothetical protein
MPLQGRQGAPCLSQPVVRHTGQGLQRFFVIGGFAATVTLPFNCAKTVSVPGHGGELRD